MTLKWKIVLFLLKRLNPVNGVATRLIVIRDTPADFPHYDWQLERIGNHPGGQADATLTGRRRA